MGTLPAYRIIMKFLSSVSTLAMATACAAVGDLDCTYGGLEFGGTCDGPQSGLDYDGDDCNVATHSCLSANWFSWNAAYGCYPKGFIDSVKADIVDLCQGEPACVGSNPNGNPVNGWQICTTNGCNSCGAASSLAPSFLIPFAAVVSAALVARL